MWSFSSMMALNRSSPFLCAVPQILESKRDRELISAATKTCPASNNERKRDVVSWNFQSQKHLARVLHNNDPAAGAFQNALYRLPDRSFKQVHNREQRETPPFFSLRACRQWIQWRTEWEVNACTWSRQRSDERVPVEGFVVIALILIRIRRSFVFVFVHAATAAVTVFTCLPSSVSVNLLNLGALLCGDENKEAIASKRSQ